MLAEQPDNNPYESIIDGCHLQAIEITISKIYYDPDKQKEYHKYINRLIPVSNETAAAEVLTSELDQYIESYCEESAQKLRRLQGRRRMQLDDVYHYVK